MNGAGRSHVEAVLAERARLFAQPLVEPRTGASLDVVCFAIGDERFAIAAALVERIVPLPPVTRLPGTPPYLAGVANVRGGLVPVFDLARLLGIPIAAEATHLLVLGRDGFDLAILASAVSELAEIERAAGTANDVRPLVQRVLPDGRALIDGEALLDDPRMVVGSKHEEQPR